MGLRFRKSIQLLPGVKLNIGKSSVGVSLGGKFGGISLNSKTGAHARASLPGTGLSYTTRLGGKNKKSSEKKRELERRLKESEHLEETKKNELLVQEYETYIDTIRRVHIDCEEPVEWTRITMEDYCDVIQEANPFEDLLEYGSGFEFGTDDPKLMEIEFQVRSDTVVPKNSRALTKTGKLTEKPLTKTAYYDITQDYVCSCAIRLAREIFALLPVETVIVHADDQVLNTATGKDEILTILSVKFQRKGFDHINFDRIDPSDFLETFEHRMKFKKTAGFEPVKRLS